MSPAEWGPGLDISPGDAASRSGPDRKIAVTVV